uniref:Presenilin enhancer, gamma-secretase subunit n=1 Tax=Taeniopygia guttata TaxID=59729 RepID=A0A674GAU5_TAEGU
MDFGLISGKFWPDFAALAPGRRAALGAGAGLWGLGLGLWVGLFQTRRGQWGALGDALSFTQPMGEP